MKILLLYTTNSGSTEMAANEIMQRLTGNHQVDMKRVTEATPDDVTSHDAVLMASPTWDYAEKEGLPHEDFVHFKEKMDPKLFENKPMAIVGLGDSSYRIFCGAADEMAKWVTDWKAKSLAPPLKIDKYYYRLAENVEAIEKWTQELKNALH